ncbi:MAG: ankyrin repeat domain-containing protein [Thermoanaerobaculia bacterium]
MKRGCLISLLILAACFGGYWYVLHGHIEPPAFWWATGLASFFMWIAVSMLQGSVTSARDAMRVSSESSFGGYGGEQFEDDAIVTVVGHIRAVGSTLRAPFSGNAAVLYGYDIDHISQSSHDSTNVMDYSGFALAPCAIDSPHGSVRILGFPMLEGFPKKPYSTDDGRKNAAAYLEATALKDMQGFHPGTIFHEIKELLTDDDGQFRKDWKMTEDRDLSDKDLREQIVAPGDQVCAIGRWSAAKHGLIPPAGGAIRLLQGDPQKIVSGLWRKCIGGLIGGLIFAAAVNGAVYTLLQISAGKSKLFAGTPMAKHSIHGDEMVDAVSNGNLTTVQKLFENGTGVDVHDTGGRTTLAVAQDAAMARWLIAHGADVNAADGDGQTVLMQQASAGRTEVVRALVNAGAKLDTLSTKWHSTALTQALDAEKLDVVRILRDAGAKDDTVTESKGQPVRESDPPVQTCFVWLDAIQREDLGAMKAASVFKSFDDVDFKLWKSIRPVHPKLVHGYATGEAATVEIRGQISSRTYGTWTYQLIRDGEKWRVNDERWETRLNSREP